MQLRFDGRVAIVTGAGLGLGRSYAIELARRGAKVVVNDVAIGDGGVALAESVAGEIRSMGGQAVASTHSVEDGNAIVDATLSSFDRVDILVNNAGVLRNNSFLKMTEEDWDVVYRVHLLGTMHVTKAVWPHMRDARFGRIVMTTSTAGICGSVGAANYAAAKAGTIAFAQTLALEGAPRNVKVNAVAPMAGSRLTSTIWPAKVLDAFPPEQVAPAIAWLVHEDSNVTGRVFEVGGGWLSEHRWAQSPGMRFESSFTAEDVADRWNEATAFDDSGKTSPNYIDRIEMITGVRVQF